MKKLGMFHSKTGDWQNRIQNRPNPSVIFPRLKLPVRARSPAPSEAQNGAYAALDEGVGEQAGNLVGSLPSGAMARNDVVKGELAHLVESAWDHRVHNRAGQVTPANKGMDPID